MKKGAFLNADAADGRELGRIETMTRYPRILADCADFDEPTAWPRGFNDG
jgi:hypothetical protein